MEESKHPFLTKVRNHFRKISDDGEDEGPLYKRIISYVVSILCLLLCLYITTEVIVANTNGRPPRIFNLSVSYVPTASMEPTIAAGSYIMFKKADWDSVNEDDIVIYYNETEAKYIVHRVISKNTDTGVIITKGDNNDIADSVEVTKTSNMIYGKYLTTLGFMAIFAGGINQNLIFFILIAIFAIMLVMQVASIIIKGKTDKIKEEQENEKNKLREQMKKELMAEELAKLKAELQAEALKKNDVKEETKEDKKENL